MKTLKVSSKTAPMSAAGAIAGYIKEEGRVELAMIGAGAVNQAVKAVAIARGFVCSQGMDLICVPSFDTIVTDGEERTVMRIVIDTRGIS